MKKLTAVIISLMMFMIFSLSASADIVMPGFPSSEEETNTDWVTSHENQTYESTAAMTAEETESVTEISSAAETASETESVISSEESSAEETVSETAEVTGSDNTSDSVKNKVIACVSVPVIIAGMAAVTLVYVKKKRNQ